MKRTCKRALSMLLVLIMLLGVLPMTALATLDTGHSIDVRFTVLYVSDEFNLGYNTGSSEKTTFVCQYSTPHSDTAYNNHTIAIADIKAAADRATVNSGYEIVGWSKEAKANPQIWGFDLVTPTACNKGSTIYLVAKKSAPATTDYTLYYNGNGGEPQQGRTFSKSPNDSYTFIVKDDTPTKGDLHFMGWADTHTATIAQYQPGDRITLYKANPTKTIFAVWGGHEDADGDGFCDIGKECLHKHDNGYCTEENCNHQHGPNDCCPLEPQPPVKPNPAQVQGLLQNAVKVDCTNTAIDPQHEDKTYNLKSGTYTIGNVEGNATDGYTCTITVTPDAYVALYNEEISANHTLDPERQTGTITLHYVPDPSNPDGTVSTWQVKSGVPVTFYVECETPEPEKPATPTDEQLIRLLAGKITVDCVNTEIDPEHDNKTYGLLTDSYEIGDVTGNETDGYFCNVTIKPATYVAEYNKTLPGHTAVATTTDKTIVLEMGGTGWIVSSGAPVTFYVECETPEPEPEAPTDLSNILTNNFVTVECISKFNHSPKSLSYGLLEGGYTIGNVEGDAENGYTCKVTFYADVYQAAYNDGTKSKHELYPEQQPASIVLYWDKETGWTAPDGYAVRFTVTCDDDRSYYTVTYTDGVPGATIFEDQTYYVLAGSKTPAFDGTPKRPGYVFTGWTPAVATTVTGDVVYTATWRRVVTPVVEEKDDPFYVRDLNYEDHVAYINGYPDGTVRPTGDITRAEAATIFFRLMTDSARNKYWRETSRFTDVADSAWYAVAVATLDKYGAIVDSENGEFRPDEPITRAELAVMAAQFCTLKYDSTKTSFTDVSRNYWAAKEIALIEQAGWIVGHNGEFRPNDTITRAETITIINRMLHRGVDDEGMLKGMIKFSDNVRSAWYYEAVQEAANSHTYTYSNRWIPGEGFHYENWQKLVKNPDWVAIERGWKDAHK